MSKKENAKNHFCKRSSLQIEIDEEDEIDTFSKNGKMGSDNNFTKSEHQMRERMLKIKPSDNDKIVRISRRSTLSNQEYEH